jgi:hypothetical protein
MMRVGLCLAAIICISSSAFSQETPIHATVTYVGLGTVYLSAGRDLGVEDSTLFYTIVRSDTVAVLKVFGASSRSAVCTVLSAKRPPVIGDSAWAVVAAVKQKEQVRSIIAESPRDTPASPGTLRPGEAGRITSPAVSVRGRIALQYYRAEYEEGRSIATQPGLALELRGNASDRRFTFDLSANLRSFSSAKSLFFSTNSVNQTRVYRASAAYEDAEYQIGLGRIAPRYSPSIGYIDGVTAARRLGDVTIGTAIGFEPEYTQRKFSADLFKLALFAAYASPKTGQLYSNISYARSYFHSTLNREVVSAFISCSPASALFLSVNADIDIHTKLMNTFVLAPQVSMFSAMASYRPFRFLSCSMGMSSYRAVISFAAVKDIPDSLLDTRLRSNPTVTVNISLPANLSVYDNYSPRLARDGSEKEYLNNVSLAFSPALLLGTRMRIGRMDNVSSFASTGGYDGALEKSFGSTGDVTLRLQSYNSTLTGSGIVQSHRSYALDFMTGITSTVSFYGSIGRTVGSVSYSLMTDLSWRF